LLSGASRLSRFFSIILDNGETQEKTAVFAHRVQTDCKASPSSYTMDTASCVPGNTATGGMRLTSDLHSTSILAAPDVCLYYSLRLQ
jgi:hypothetical protein